VTTHSAASKRTTTKPAYLWALGITTALTVWALVAPTPGPAPVVAEMQRGQPLADAIKLQQSISPASASSATRAASTDESPTEISPAQLDIFADRRHPSVDAPAPPPVLPAAPVELVGPPLPPPPPALNVQYAGRFRTPDGRLLIYLRDGDKSVVAKIGDAVSSGYQIAALLGDGQKVLKVDDNASRVVALRFVYAPLRHTETLVLPPDAGAP
jgi:hypothetical protein